MSVIARASTSYSSVSTSYPSYSSSATPRLGTRRTNDGRPSTKSRTTASTTGGTRDQQITCAISESRGIAPIVGLAFVNSITSEAVLCQISDNQTFVRTIHKLFVFQPTEILFMTTAARPKSKLFSTVEANLPMLPNTRMVIIDRKYWAETAGLDYIQQLAFKQDVEAIKVSLGGNFYATCCIAAVLKYIELQLNMSFSLHSLRIRYEPPEGSMMIDLSTIHSLELIQNLQNVKSKDCLFGVLNQTLTPMGARMLKSNLLQPLIEVKYLERRYDAVGELAAKEYVFLALRQGLKAFIDVDRVLTAITVVPCKPSIQYCEQSINNIIMLKQYVKSIPPIYEALKATKSELLLSIFRLCAPDKIANVEVLIDETINPDITYSSQPLDLRNQRTYAVKASQVQHSGVNGLLDVARQTYKEANADAFQLVTDLAQTHHLALELKYDAARQYFIQIPASELEDRELPDVFINEFRRKRMVECQTLDLLKWNQKITDSHHEVLQMSDASIQDLIYSVREEIEPLFKACEAIAELDMIAAFAHLAITKDYCKPEMTQTLAVKDGRHVIRETIHAEKYIPNDAYAAQQSRFQIITGCNMSGKSIYIRSLALMAVMAQIGCFIPANYASFPIFHQLFARISMDDSIEANVSTFAAEMRETAFILRNVDKRSMVIIDELGRGTSTRDGISIAIAVAEALVESKALVWFATHFRDLATILAERNGVVSLHLAVEMGDVNKMRMLYKIANGSVQEKHYGLALARVINLPADVMKVAEEVSNKLALNIERQKKNPMTIAVARRRKLVLSLREQLIQARDGNMQGKVLLTWMKKLQDEFVLRMAAVDAEVEAARREQLDDAQSVYGSEVEESGRRNARHERETESTNTDTNMSQNSSRDDDSCGGQRYEMTGALQIEMEIDE